MIALLRELRSRLRDRRAPAVARGPDPAVPLARAALERAFAAGASVDGLAGVVATSAEGAALLEAARALAGPGAAVDGAALSRAVTRVIAEDGAPRGDPALAAEVLLAVAMVRARVSAAGGALPTALDGALAAGSDALYRLQGEQDALPSPAPVHALIPGPLPVPHSLRDATLAWGLDEGPPAAAEDERARRLTGRSPEGAPAALAQDRWALWSWRETGLAVAHARMLKRPARLYLDAREGAIAWDMPGLPLLSGRAGAGGHLETCRVDGRKARLIARADDGSWRRDVLAQGSRVIVKDHGLQQIRFKTSETFSLEVGEGGWRGRAAGLSLEIKVDGSWRWTLDGGVLTGLRGQGAEEVQSSFELRT